MENKESIAQSSKKAFELTSNQKKAFENFRNFISNDQIKVFILKGYAGTGKTTLI